MCGITGIYSFNSVGRIGLVHLEKATKRLESRGPDVQDTWFDEVVGLGHRRLSILDTSPAGNQPMCDESGRYHIVYNGEIYNFRQIKKALLQKGVSFKSETDTEVLLYAYIEWGPSFVKKLNGFFAFAIYDKEESSLFVARDRYGIKPLFIHLDQNRFAFASEIKSLLSYGIKKEINHEALHLYFQLTYIPQPYSIFKGIRKLEPGTYLIIKKKEVKKYRYYKVPTPDASKILTFDEAKVQLLENLRKAVHDRLISDVPLGAFLSGGIDSSIITALASEKVKDLKTFSIGFEGNAYFDETNYAQMVADRYKTDHQVFSLTNDDLLATVGDAVSYMDEPFADSSALPVYILSKMTREKVTVALSGDGADELFSGYNKHKAWAMSMNGGLKTGLIKSLSPIWKKLPKSRNSKIADTFRKLDRFAEMQKFSLKDRYWFLASFAKDEQISSLLKKDYHADNLDGVKSRYLQRLSTGDLNEVLATDTELVLPGDMLTKVDMMSMANSLEVRVPFLDPRVVKTAFSVPPCYKMKDGESKYLLKETFRHFLPLALLERPKHGFEVPLLPWFRKELKQELEDKVFNKEKIEQQGIFDWNEIERIKTKLYSYDPGDVTILIWSLFVFQSWYDRYFK